MREAFDEFAPKRVGKFYKSLGKEFTYSSVKFDKDKWADAAYFLPYEFDLVWCIVQNNAKHLTGWFTGTCWDGHHIEPSDIILKWKMNYDH